MDDIEDAESLDLVRFRVSEYIYVCHKSTLLKFPDSKLGQLVKPGFDMRKSGLDHIVINRDGKLFGLIIKMMRDISEQSWWKELSEIEANGLVSELNFFHLYDLTSFFKTSNELLPTVQVGSIDANLRYTFHKRSIVLPSTSLAGFNDEWPAIIKELRLSRKFEIFINNIDNNKYQKPEANTFRFFLPSNLYKHNPNALPRLFDKDSDSYGDLVYQAPTKYQNRSKENFLKFLVAIEMHLKSTKPDDLLAIEKCIPGVKFKRHPIGKNKPF